MNIISLVLIFLGISVGVLVTSLKSEDKTAINDDVNDVKVEQVNKALQESEKTESKLLDGAMLNFNF